MIKITVIDKEYHIPTNWSEVTYITFAESRNAKTIDEKIAYYSGIPIDVLSNLALTDVLKIAELVTWMEREPEMYEAIEIDVNVQRESFGKMEAAKQALNKNNPFVAMIDIVKTYCKVDISNEPVTKVFGYTAFFLST